MSATIEKTRILVVDTSTAMLHVLQNFSDKHGYESDCFADPVEACRALDKRFQRFDSDYQCVLLGWPEGSTEIVSELLTLLISPDHQDLAVVLICQEMTSDIQSLVKKRAKTRALLWKDYQAAADIIDRQAIAAPATPMKKSVATVESAVNSSKQPSEKSKGDAAESSVCVKALLLDGAPSICHVLRDLMESNGYDVAVAGSVQEGRKACESEKFDLIVTDFFLRGEGGEEFCRYLQSKEQTTGHRPVCIMLTNKYSDTIVKRSLAVGAASCLYKDESTELLFARINALVKAIPAASAVTAVSGSTEFASVQLLDLMPDPAILVDNKGVISGINAQANDLLNDTDQHKFTCAEFAAVVCATPITVGVVKKAGLLTKAGSKVSIDYIARKIDIKNSSPGVLICFDAKSLKVAASVKEEPVLSVVNPDKTPDAPVGPLTSVVKPLNGNTVKPVVAAAKPKVAELEPVNTIETFTKNLSMLLEKDTGGVRHSVLLLDIQLIAATGDRLCIGDSEPMLKIVNQSLAQLYTRENSFNYLGDGQFGFLLATRRIQDALVLTRKLLQVVPQLVKYLNNMSLVSHGAVLQLSQDSDVSVEQALNKCRSACAKARADGRDNAALVMPMNKYLSAEAAREKTDVKDMGAAVAG